MFQYQTLKVLSVLVSVGLFQLGCLDFGDSGGDDCTASGAQCNDNNSGNTTVSFDFPDPFKPIQEIVDEITDPEAGPALPPTEAVNLCSETAGAAVGAAAGAGASAGELADLYENIFTECMSRLGYPARLVRAKDVDATTRETAQNILKAFPTDKALENAIKGASPIPVQEDHVKEIVQLVHFLQKPGSKTFLLSIIPRAVVMTIQEKYGKEKYSR